jgi:hypothetical protein
VNSAGTSKVSAMEKKKHPTVQSKKIQKYQTACPELQGAIPQHQNLSYSN